MRLSTKHVPPRRLRGLREILFFGANAKVVGAISTTATVRNYVIYVVFFGVVALAGLSLKALNHLSLLHSGNVASAARPGALDDDQLREDRDDQGCFAVVGDLLENQKCEHEHGNGNKRLSQFLRDTLATAIDRQHYQHSKQEQHSDDGIVRSHALSIFHALAQLGNGTLVPRMAGETL
jgi:hypothetical protein